MPDLAAALDELAADGAARSRSASLSSARNEPAAPSDDGEETSDGDPGGSTVLGEEDTGPATLQLADGRLRATLVPLPVQRAGTPYVLVVLAPADRHRYEAWGRLAQRVAHDLKNPLTSILLSLQRMQMEYRTGDDGRDPGDLADTLDDYTTRIEERIATLRRMTTNVLKFVGEEKPRRTATNLSRFVAQHEDTLAEDLPPDIDLRLRLDDVPAAHVDQDQMQSVLDNLLTNAVEAMPGGGTITVSTYLAQDLYLDETHPQDYVVVEVLDTGTGMTEEEEERLFEPGFSTRDSTGLGLSIVRKIVHDHDGRIAVETEPEVGTGISIYLPAAE
jgi:signal transduction histidine kinase